MGWLTAAISSPGKLTKTVTLADEAHPRPQPRVRQLREVGHTLLASVALPALPRGSTLRLVTALLSGTKVEHQVATALTRLGRASVRTVHVPADLPTGSTAAVTLIELAAGAPGPLVTSTAATNLTPGAHH